jgi:hypothetical protein
MIYKTYSIGYLGTVIVKPLKLYCSNPKEYGFYFFCTPEEKRQTSETRGFNKL